MRFTHRTLTTENPSGWRCATTGRRLPAQIVEVRDRDRVLCTLTGEFCMGYESARNRAEWMVRLLNLGRATADRVPADAESWTTSSLYDHLTA